MVLLILMKKEQMSMSEILENLYGCCKEASFIISVFEVASFSLFCRNHFLTISMQSVIVVVVLKGLLEFIFEEFEYHLHIDGRPCLDC